MIKAFLTALIFLVLCAFLQALMPTFHSVANSRILLVISCVSVLILFFGYTQGLLFAFLAGVFQDAAHILNYYADIPEIIEQPVEHLKFGYSIILLGVVTLMTKIFQNLAKLRGVIPTLLWISFAISSYLVLECLLIAFVRGSFPHGELWLKQIGYSVLFSTAAAFGLFSLFLLFLKLLNVKRFHTLQLNTLLSIRVDS